MAGVKECTPGFALECFGFLYVYTKRHKGKSIKFIHTKKKIRKNVLDGITAAINLSKD